ncbi:MAG: leucine-rich repeat domain-containing protein [Aureispira sp.]|nr:leucine-rich repeat domain-containing protein [Aureispira sp.]
MMQHPENWDKIISLLQSGERDNIELAYQLAGKNVPMFWPTLRNLKNTLSSAKTQPPIHWLEMPFGQLCYVLKIVLAMTLEGSTSKELPAEIAFFKSLVILEIKDCAFEVLPEEIGQLQKIKTLSIKNCPIKQLPKSITQLPNLGTLILRNNQLLSLPEGLQNLSKLKHLDISNNPQLQVSGKAITALPNLEELVLDEGTLHLIHSNILKERKIKITYA